MFCLKDESPYYGDVLSEVETKMQDLQELNNNKAIPTLVASQENLRKQFDRAGNMASQLESVIASFSDEREGLLKVIDQETKWLNQMKDKLGNCDDVSGTDADVVKRLTQCKVSSFHHHHHHHHHQHHYHHCPKVSFYGFAGPLLLPSYGSSSNDIIFMRPSKV
jgi:DNA repair ATPase RecN